MPARKHPLAFLALALAMFFSPATDRRSAADDGQDSASTASGAGWNWLADVRVPNLSWRAPEIVEMLGAMLGGSQMGPGGGWFHAGQSRYDFRWLADRHDLNADGAISREEFQGDLAWFGILDRTQDGLLAPDDLEGSSGSSDAQQMQMVARWFGPMDGNSNGRISKEEWAVVFDRLSDGKGYLSPRDIRKLLLGPGPGVRPAPQPVARQPEPAPAEPENDGGPSVGTLLKGLAQGELGSWQEGPRIDQEAPDFDLPLFEGQGRIGLSQFRGKMPVVLIFGSFT